MAGNSRCNNAENPDGVILNGDMIDFFSEANLNYLMTDLKRIKAPVMYNRADHDLGIWYSDTYTDEDVQQERKRILGYGRGNGSGF